MLTVFQGLTNTQKNCLVSAVFALLVVLFYGNTLWNGFVQDDIQVEKNPYLQSLKNLPKVVTACSLEYVNKGCKGRLFYYRPMPYLSYFLTYQISSQPWIFHLVNLIYFTAAVFLVFLLAKALAKNIVFAFLAALIFLIHPINSEVVNWISAASEILFIIFVLLGLIYYLKYRGGGGGKNLILVCLFYFFALLSKETAVFFPLVIPLIDFFFFGTKIKEIISWKEFKKYLIFAVPFSIYFLMRTAVIGGGSYLGQFSSQERIYLAISLFAKYLEKIFYPYPLQAIYDFNPGLNFLSFSFLAPLAAVSIFSVLFIFFIKKQKNLLAFSMVWFALFILPPIVFLQAAGAGTGLFLERYLFVSSIGFSLALAYILYYGLKIACPQKPQGRRWENQLFKKRVLSFGLWIVVGFLVIGSWYVVYQRNGDWKDNETLYTKTLFRVPDAHNLRYQLGAVYLKKGELEQAREQFEEIISRDPNWQEITMAHKGLGDYYRAKNDLNNALASYQKAVETAAPTPRDYVTFNDLGAAYMEKGNFLKGFIYFCQSLLLYPESEITQSNLDAAISVIDSTYNASGTLHQTTKKEFAKSPQEKIKYLDKKCSQNACQYAFSLRSESPELLHPVLISAATFSEEGDVLLQEPSFDPEKNIITIQVDKKFSSQPLTFFFPTCQGLYYQVNTE